MRKKADVLTDEAGAVGRKDKVTEWWAVFRGRDGEGPLGEDCAVGRGCLPDYNAPRGGLCQLVLCFRTAWTWAGRPNRCRSDSSRLGSRNKTSGLEARLAGASYSGS